MKAKQIFNGIFFMNLVSVIVIVVQSMTGFFIDPAIQVGILTLLNLVFRFTTGGIKAPVEAKPDVKPKLLYESKVFWTSVLAFAGGITQSITGWAIPPEVYLQVISGIAFLLSVITHKPVVIA